jgi:hypothetical protein
MSASDQAAGFFVMPFAIDGESVGIDFWQTADLASHWLEFCKNHLACASSAFDGPLSDELSHIRFKCSCTKDTALMTFSIGGRIISSVVLLSGQSPAAEVELIQMFVASLRRSSLVIAAAGHDEAFEQLLAAKERPLMAVVHWPDDAVSDDDDDVVRELGLHFAGAFFADA